jgi:hypothetical protein
MTMRTAIAITIALALAGPAMAEDFTTRAQAMDYLVQTLPKATSQNPEYLTKSDGIVSRWLTHKLHFARTGQNAVTVKMWESYTQTKDGKTTPGTHEAAFSLAQVEISEFASPGDFTPEGAPARGIIFVCAKAGCISALWSGHPSSADKTDIYIQDEATRARILAAFRRLQTE